MPRILRIANRFNLGGPTFNVAYLTKHLAPEFETMLVGGEKDETEASSSHILDELGITPVIIPEMRRELSPGLDYAAYKRIRQIIRDFKPDIVHTHAAKAGAVGRQAAFDMKVPVVLHTFHGHVFHSYFGKLKTEFYRQVERAMAKRSTRIIAISELQRHELSAVHAIAPADKIEVIPLGFDLGRFMEGTEEKRHSLRQELGIGPEEVAIGIVGRLVPIKDHRLFLRLAKRLLAVSPQAVRFVIVGGGEDEQALLAYCGEIGLGHGPVGTDAPVIFTSWRTDIDRVYAGIDIAVLTSKNEGTPVSLIEAQASSRPVVSTDVGGVADVVAHGITGFIAPHGDEAALLAPLRELVSNPARRGDMGEAARAHVADRYHFTRLVSDMAALYGRLLGQPPIR